MKKTMQTIFLFLVSAFAFVACSDGSNSSTSETSGTETAPVSETAASSETEVHGDAIKAEDVQLTTPLNAEWAAAGKSIYDLKCQSCHKLTDERVVGPGWKGVTQRREPHWIMNMITNVDMMLEKDPEAQKLLEQCLVRMPNQNITKEDARKILEYMRQNDGVQ